MLIGMRVECATRLVRSVACVPESDAGPCRN
jgi:hypothetical protein